MAPSLWEQLTVTAHLCFNLSLHSVKSYSIAIFVDNCHTYLNDCVPDREVCFSVPQTWYEMQPPKPLRLKTKFLWSTDIPKRHYGLGREAYEENPLVIKQVEWIISSLNGQLIQTVCCPWSGGVFMVYHLRGGMQGRVCCISSCFHRSSATAQDPNAAWCRPLPWPLTVMWDSYGTRGNAFRIQTSYPPRGLPRGQWGTKAALCTGRTGRDQGISCVHAAWRSLGHLKPQVLSGFVCVLCSKIPALPRCHPIPKWLIRKSCTTA